MRKFRPPTIAEGGIPAHSVLSEGRHGYRDVVGFCSYAYSALASVWRRGADGAGALALRGPEHVSEHAGGDAGTVRHDSTNVGSRAVFE